MGKATQKLGNSPGHGAEEEVEASEGKVGHSALYNAVYHRLSPF
jgi:hypothetical protein